MIGRRLELWFDLRIKPLLCQYRVVQWLAGDCPCCALWRGVVFGGILGWLLT